MRPISAAPSAPDDDRTEVDGRLTIDGARKNGVYGAFWNVTITPDHDLPPVQATLSEKVWGRLGLPAPDAATSVRVTARRNANGRWNVTHVEAGPGELKCALATIVRIDRTFGDAACDNNHQVNETLSATDEIISYRLRLAPQQSEPFDVRVASRALARFGIISLPLNHAFIADWSREPWGWKLDRIDDLSLLAFFDPHVSATSTARGRLTADWKFDDGVNELNVEFSTNIPGISLHCRLYARTLRNAGLRALSTSDPVIANLLLRDGRWRLAELLEPRPDRAIRTQGEIIYAVETRLAFREENRFGQLVNWLEILDARAGLEVTSLHHAKLIEIGEATLAPGAHIVCDLEKGKSGWHASRIYRIAD